jgi:hypothetical protein
VNPSFPHAFFNTVLVLEELDAEFGKVLANNNKPDAKITIIWAGGIVGVRLGARDTKTKKGVTGDIDYLYHTKTTEDEKKWFLEAIKTVVANHPQKLHQKTLPISNSLEFGNPTERIKEWVKLSDASNDPSVFDGKHLEAKDGDMLYMLYG